MKVTIYQSKANAKRIKIHIPYPLKELRECIKKLNTSWYHPHQKLWSIVNDIIGIHSLNWASMLHDLSEATGDEKMKERSIQTANYITYYLQQDNRILTGYSREFPRWFSCHTGVVYYLFNFIEKD